MGFRSKDSAKKLSRPKAASDLDPTLNEDPLEFLLDEQSDHEFGDLVLKDSAKIRAGKSVKLAEWTAQDFSSVYVRFRPHLERHARRFLSNPSQVDEVVQDAFLYLMVSLPELDSEIGVLRFLKWKTRLLAIDVIRASGRAYINSIDEVPEPESPDPEVSSYLEQQDDAAIVRLALSKLNPRHREVLIASMYEEKTTEQISRQVGLSENATRQLIFRARSAFKKALIGDVDTKGMSAGAILSVAARKAAQESKKIGLSAMALIAMAVLSLTGFQALNRSPVDQIAQNVPAPSTQPAPESNTTPSQEPPVEPGDQNNSSGTSSPEASGQDSTDAAGPAQAMVTRELVQGLNAANDSSPFSEASIEKLFSASDSSRLYVMDERLVVFAENGVSASFTFNPTDPDQPFREVFAEFELGSEFFAAYPDNSEWVSAVDPEGMKHFVFFGSLKYVYDEQGKVWSQSEIAQGTLRIEVIVDKSTLKIVQAQVHVLPKL